MPPRTTTTKAVSATGTPAIGRDRENRGEDDAGGGRQGAAQAEAQHVQARGVHAIQLRHLAILAGGSDDAAEPGLLDDQKDGHDHGRPGDEGRQALVAVIEEAEDVGGPA